MKLNIRRKLFLAFLGAAAVPLAMFVALTRSYIDRTRTSIDQEMVGAARLAFKTIDRRAGERLEALERAVEDLASDLFSPEPPEPPELPAPPKPPQATVKPKLPALPKDLDLEKLEAKLEAAAERIAAVVTREGKVARVLIRRQQRPLHSDERQIHRWRTQHPAVRGVKLLVDGKPSFSDLAPDYDLAGAPAAAALAGKEGDPVAFEDGERRFIAFKEADAALLVEYDPAALLDGVGLGHRGYALYVEADGRPRVAPDALETVRARFPLPALVAALPAMGELGHVSVGQVGWSVYHALPSERARSGLGGGARLVAFIPEEDLYAPIARFRLQVLAVIAGSIAIALLLAFFLSGRFVGAVEDLKRGVEALSRGELAQLETSSRDELGELMEGVNRAATAIAERQRKEEVEGWRRLVRVLSHEINNTLGPVKSVATTVRDQVSRRIGEGDAAEDLQLAFRLIVDRVDALAGFIAGYAELAKLPDPETAPADLNALARGAVAMLAEQAAARGVAVEEALDPELGTPRIDRAQVERVAINLVKNAVEAAAARVVVATAARGDAVELTVEDDGPGISPEARRHLFVPYFTTKPGGSGIGLALARQIVLAHGGTITAEERPGGGTLLRVVLPLGGRA